MATTMMPPPVTRSKPHPETRPVVMRNVPIAVKPSEEKRAQLRKDRFSAAMAVLFILALIGFVIWAAVTGEAPHNDMMWDYPYMY